MCPYCGTLQEKAITRKTSCRDCDKTILFNSKFEYIYGRTQLTRKELSLVQFWKELWQMLAIDETYYMRIKNKLAKQNLINPYDIVWYISNGEKIIEYVEEGREIGVEYMRTRLNTIQSGIASARSRFVPYYFNQDPYDFAKQAIDLEIDLMRSVKEIKSIYVDADNCCEPCKQGAGVLMLIKEASDNAILPNKKCTRKLEDTDFVLCNCHFLPDFNLNYI